MATFRLVLQCTRRSSCSLCRKLAAKGYRKAVKCTPAPPANLTFDQPFDRFYLRRPARRNRNPRCCSLPSFDSLRRPRQRGVIQHVTTGRGDTWLPGLPRVVWRVPSDLEERTPLRPPRQRLMIHCASQPRRYVGFQGRL